MNILTRGETHGKIPLQGIPFIYCYLADLDLFRNKNIKKFIYFLVKNIQLRITFKKLQIVKHLPHARVHGFL